MPHWFSAAWLELLVGLFISVGYNIGTPSPIRTNYWCRWFANFREANIPNDHFTDIPVTIEPVGDANIYAGVHTTHLIFSCFFFHQKPGMQHAFRLPTSSQVSLQLRNGCLHFCFLQGNAQKTRLLCRYVQPDRSSPLLFGLLTNLLHFLPWKRDPLVRSCGALLLLQYMCADWSQVRLQQNSLRILRILMNVSAVPEY